MAMRLHGSDQSLAIRLKNNPMKAQSIRSFPSVDATHASVLACKASFRNLFVPAMILDIQGPNGP